MRELVIKRVGQTIRRCPLDAERVLLGRDPSCEVVLDSTFVSRKHAILVRRGETYEVADEGSRNGVLVNGERLARPRRLKKGDEISIADFSLTYWESSGEGETEVYEGVPHGTFIIDVNKRLATVGVGGAVLLLSRQEFDLLALLNAKNGAVCRRDEIGEVIWGSDDIGGRRMARYDDNMIHRLVSRLKGKLDAGGAGHLIANVPGVGYRLDDA